MLRSQEEIEEKLQEMSGKNALWTAGAGMERSITVGAQ